MSGAPGFARAKGIGDSILIHGRRVPFRPSGGFCHKVSSRQQFQSSDEGIPAGRTAGLLMTAQALDMNFRQSIRQKPGPRPHAIERRWFIATHQIVRPFGNVRTRARPSPCFRCGNHLRTHRVQFDGANRGDQMILVERKGMEPRLPKMATPALAPVDGGGIAPVCLGNCPAQTIGSCWHEHQVHVVGHQAVGQNSDAGAAATRRHQIQIGGVAGVVEKRLQAPVTTLCDVMSDAWNDDAG